ncbi:MAG TPA: hypothetical protein VKT77_04160 [Chthonomonadaceae bacterium]|nr:hypothetical protein [Chthonomonadaceae bacterium]
MTIGELWKFLELSDLRVSIDSRTYHIEHVAKIMGMLSALALGTV